MLSGLVPLPTTELTVVIGLAAVLPILRWVLLHTVFQPVARAALVSHHVSKSGVIPDKLAGKITKFTESQWKFFCYTSFVVIGYFSVAVEPWFTDTRQYWTDWPHQPMTVGMKLLYAAEAAYYLSSIAMLALWEVPRKDQNVMMLHHFLTVVLIGLSYQFHFQRSACVIMLLHDVNDVLMEVAKSLNYCQLEAAATAVFAAFIACWAALRIFCFPFFILYSTIFEVQEVLGYKPPCYYVINGGFLILYCIHLYWFRLILHIAYIKITTGEGHDIREDEDD